VNYTFLIEFIGFGVAALGWAGWELWSLRRDSEVGAKSDKSSKDSTRHPEG
jgi:hypothetical protein